MCWFSRKCKHKYGAFVDEDNFQFCIKCGAARKVEVPHVHDWVLVGTTDVYRQGATAENSYPVYRTRSYECSVCKETKVRKV